MGAGENGERGAGKMPALPRSGRRGCGRAALRNLRFLGRDKTRVTNFPRNRKDVDKGMYSWVYGLTGDGDFVEFEGGAWPEGVGAASIY